MTKNLFRSGCGKILCFAHTRPQAGAYEANRRLRRLVGKPPYGEEQHVGVGQDAHIPPGHLSFEGRLLPGRP